MQREHVRRGPRHHRLVRRLYTLGQKEHHGQASAIRREVERNVFPDPVTARGVARVRLGVERRVIVVVHREVAAEGGVVHRLHGGEIARHPWNRRAGRKEVLPGPQSSHEPDPIDGRAIEFGLRVDLAEEVRGVGPATAQDVPAPGLARVHRPLANVAREVEHTARTHASRCSAAHRASRLVPARRHHPPRCFWNSGRIPLVRRGQLLPRPARECPRLVPAHAAHGKIVAVLGRQATLPR